MNKCFLMDCRELLKLYKYDYVFTGPFDFDEINWEPTKNNIEKYKSMMEEVFKLLKPKNNVVTFSFTDRKYNGSIVPKSFWYKEIMFDLGWYLHSHKIWQKSSEVNLYRLNYSNILSFGKGKVKQDMKYKPFKYDIWNEKDDKYDGYKMGFPINNVRKCIRNYTTENQVVCDPFMGSGSTAIAALTENRQYLGSDINKTSFKICQKRLSEFDPIFGIENPTEFLV